MKKEKKYKQFGLRRIMNVPFGIGVYFAVFGFFFFFISSLVFLGIQGDINGGAIGVCFGLVFAGIGIAVAVWAKKPDRTAKKLIAQDIKIRAQVVGDIINPNVHINGKCPDRLVLKLDDGYSEPTYYVSGDVYIVFNLNKAKGAYADVYFDGTDRSKYCVDLNSLTAGELSESDKARFGESPTAITSLPSLEAFLSSYPAISQDGTEEGKSTMVSDAPITPLDEYNPFDIDPTDDDPFN